jgi:hypothetical protein
MSIEYVTPSAGGVTVVAEKDDFTPFGTFLADSSIGEANPPLDAIRIVYCVDAPGATYCTVGCTEMSNSAA